MYSEAVAIATVVSLPNVVTERSAIEERSLWTPRVILNECRDFAVELSWFELHNGDLVPFIHLDITYFSPRVLRELLALWERLRPTLPEIIFAQGTIDDNKLAKLVTKFGFQYHSDCPCDDGLTRKLFVNYKD